MVTLTGRWNRLAFPSLDTGTITHLSEAPSRAVPAGPAPCLLHELFPTSGPLAGSWHGPGTSRPCLNIASPKMPSLILPKKVTLTFSISAPHC